MAMAFIAQETDAPEAAKPSDTAARAVGHLERRCRAMGGGSHPAAAALSAVGSTAADLSDRQSRDGCKGAAAAWPSSHAGELALELSLSWEAARAISAQPGIYPALASGPRAAMRSL